MADSLEFFDDAGWERALEYVTRYIDLEPARIKTLKSAVDNIVTRTKCKNKVLKLYSMPRWQRFSQSLLLELANPVDQPFVSLMFALEREHFDYNPVSFHMWWRRLKATNQHTLITYFNLTKFKSTFEPKSFVSWSDVTENCSSTAEILKNVLEGLRSNDNVELNLRTRLGISKAADIREAWKKWAKANHPDKGGDLQEFVITKSCFEEWDAITSKGVAND